MGGSVLIDYQLKGWALRNESRIKENYSEIRYVGETPNPDASSSDSVLASFCKTNGCDMLTSDKKAYAPLLEEQNAGAVHIMIYDKDESAGRPVYRVRMV